MIIKGKKCEFFAKSSLCLIDAPYNLCFLSFVPCKSDLFKVNDITFCSCSLLPLKEQCTCVDYQELSLRLIDDYVVDGALKMVSSFPSLLGQLPALGSFWLTL